MGRASEPAVASAAGAVATGARFDDTTITAALMRAEVEKAIRRGILTDYTALFPSGAGVGPEGKRMGIMSFAGLRDIYRRNALVSAIVDTKIRQIQSLEWSIQKRKRAKDRFVPPGLADRIADIFEANANGEDFTQTLERFLKDYYVISAAAIEKVKDLSGETSELMVLDAATIVPEYDANGRLLKYRQVFFGPTAAQCKTVEFAKDDLIYLTFRPSSWSIWGLSPIESAAIEIGSHIYALNHNADQFSNGNLNDNILALMGAGQKAVEDLHAFFEENRGKGHRLPIIDLPPGQTGQAVSALLLKLTANNRDLEYMQFLYWVFRTMCAVYQVDPNQVILLESMATKASTEEMSAIHQGKSLGPDLKIIAGVFTRQVVRHFSPHLEFAFIEADKMDELEEAQVWDLRYHAGTPLNELREEAGLEPLEGPVVLIGGDEVNLFDLPINPVTGLPLGYELMDEGASQELLPGDAGSKPGPIFPLKPGGNGAPEGGEQAGWTPPWSKAQRVTKGRRRQHPYPAYSRRTHRSQDAEDRVPMPQAPAPGFSRAHDSGARDPRPGVVAPLSGGCR